MATENVDATSEIIETPFIRTRRGRRRGRCGGRRGGIIEIGRRKAGKKRSYRIPFYTTSIGKYITDQTGLKVSPDARQIFSVGFSPEQTIGPLKFSMEFIAWDIVWDIIWNSRGPFLIFDLEPKNCANFLKLMKP